MAVVLWVIPFWAMEPETLRESAISDVRNQGDMPTVLHALINLTKLGEGQDIIYLHRVLGDGSAFASFREMEPVLMVQFFVGAADFESAPTLFAVFINDDAFMADQARAFSVLLGVARLRERSDFLIPSVVLLANRGNVYETAVMQALVSIGSERAIREAFIIFDRIVSLEQMDDCLLKIFSTARDEPAVLAGFTKRVAQSTKTDIFILDVAAVFFDIVNPRWSSIQVRLVPPRANLELAALHESILLANALIKVGLDPATETAVRRCRDTDGELLCKKLIGMLINQLSLNRDPQ